MNDIKQPSDRTLTDLQVRIQSESDIQIETMEGRRSGSPEELPEIERELTMLTGAMEGLYQRLGALAAVLTPVLDPGTHEYLMTQGQGRPLGSASDFEIVTPVGQHIAKISMAIGQCEDALGALVARVRV